MLLEFSLLDFDEVFVFVEDINIKRKIKKSKREYLYKITIYPGKSFLLSIGNSNSISDEIAGSGIVIEAGFETKQDYKVLLNFKVNFSIYYSCDNYDFLINFFEH
jgi:hypothetical protein